MGDQKSALKTPKFAQGDLFGQILKVSIYFPLTALKKHFTLFPSNWSLTNTSSKKRAVSVIKSSIAGDGCSTRYPMPKRALTAGSSRRPAQIANPPAATLK